MNANTLLRFPSAAAMLAALGGCPAEDPSGHGGGTDTGGCIDEFIVPPAGHPDPAGVFTGIDVADQGYTRLAVGHVDSVANSPACCQDYALVNGPDLNTARVVFGAAGDGLQAFTNQADDVVTITARMEDIVLADFDGNNRNDIAVVVNGAFWVVEHTGSSTPPFFGTPQSYNGIVGISRAGRSLTAADVDCDGDRDLVAASVGTDHLVILTNTGAAFGAAARISTGAGMRPQRVITTDANEDGKADLVFSSADGRVGVRLANCPGWTTKGPYTLFQGLVTTDMAIAAGRVCPGHPDDIAIAAGYHDRIHVMCSSGSGEYNNVLEPHGEQVAGTPADYAWDFNDGTALNRVADLAFWSPTRELMLLYQPLGGASEVRLLDPNECASSSSAALVGELGSGAPFSRFAVHTEGAGASTEWDRFGVVGSPGLGVGQ